MNILIVDDDKLMRNMLSSMVNQAGHQAFAANGSSQALELLSQNRIHLVLMDIEMPEMNGFELTELIRDRFNTWFPIIFLSGNNSETYLERGIDVGGDDYLTKPVSQIILSAKIKAMARIADIQKALDEANQRLAKLSNLDSLTQVANRRSLDAFLQNAWQTNCRQRGELSLLMIDIDNFKDYNDSYGHQAGDECLKQVASVLKSSINRATDGLFRYGGEEFTIILPFTPVDGARFKAREIFSKMAEAQIEHRQSTVDQCVTLSIGISCSDHSATDKDELVSQADKALYLAKSQGRKCYRVYKN